MRVERTVPDAGPCMYQTLVCAGPELAPRQPLAQTALVASERAVRHVLHTLLALCSSPQGWSDPSPCGESELSSQPKRLQSVVQHESAETAAQPMSTEAGNVQSAVQVATNLLFPRVTNRPRTTSISLFSGVRVSNVGL